MSRARKSDPPIWHDASGNFRKRVTVNGKGKVYYYKYPKTKAGATLAAADWQRDLAGVEELEAAQARRLRAAEIRANISDDAHADWKQSFNSYANDLERGLSEDDANKRAAMLMAARGAVRESKFSRASTLLAELEPTVENSSDGLTVSTLLNEYLEEQYRRVEHGRKFPNAPRKDRMSPTYFVGIKFHSKSLVNDIGDTLMPSDEKGVAQLIRRYRALQTTLLTDGDIKPATFNTRIGLLRHFLGWAYTNYRIDDLPRNIAELCAKYSYDPNPKALDLKSICKIWNAASRRMKCFIALALNLGYYSSDIATLCHEHIQGGYIVRARNKTKHKAHEGRGVVTKMKLWKVTSDLLKTECNGTGDICFVNSKGNPLVNVNIDKGCRNDNISSLLWRLIKGIPSINKVAFSSLRDTSATHIERIDKELTDIFLGHVDRRMARFYIDPNYADWSRMNKAIDALENIYGLSID